MKILHTADTEYIGLPRTVVQVIHCTILGSANHCVGSVNRNFTITFSSSLQYLLFLH